MGKFDTPPQSDINTLGGNELDIDHFVAAGLKVHTSPSRPVMVLSFQGPGNFSPHTARNQIVLSIPAAVLLRRELGKAIKGYLNSADPEKNPPSG